MSLNMAILGTKDPRYPMMESPGPKQKTLNSFLLVVTHLCAPNLRRAVAYRQEHGKRSERLWHARLRKPRRHAWLCRPTACAGAHIPCYALVGWGHVIGCVW